MVCAEVAVEGSVLEHVVHGCEDGSSDGADGLVRAAPGSNAQELGLKVALLGPRSRPGALDEGGLQPRRALFHPCGAALSGAFVVLGTEPGPGDQVALGWEAAHIDADLRYDHRGR